MMSGVRASGVRRPISNASKSAIIQEIQGAVESYLALKKVDDETSLPTAGRLYPQESDFESALSSLSASITLDDQRSAQDELNRVDRESGRARPMGISRYRKGDGLMLLRDRKDRLFALLPLMPSGNKSCKGAKIEDMVCARTGEVMSFKSSTSELFPMEFCNDHHALEYLDKADIRTARVVDKGDGFELHVSFLFVADTIAHKTIIGIDRGIEILAACVVIDINTGQEIARAALDGTELRRYQRVHEARRKERQQFGRFKSSIKWRNHSDHIVHKASNVIVDLARKYDSLVVWEDLTPLANGSHHRRKKGKRRAKGFSRILIRAQYQKLQQITRYKLACHGLDDTSMPAPEVIPAYTSQACPGCGCIDKMNRRTQAVFKCVSCARTDNADYNAGRVIGLKYMHGLWLKPRLKKGRKLRDDEKFQYWLKNYAQNALIEL